MRVMVLDDEPLVLRDLMEILREAEPEQEYFDFTSPREALEFARTQPIDVAFLDIELGTMNGVVLAGELRELQPSLRVIFVTSYERYALDAFHIHANGYLLKPVAPEDIRREWEFLRGNGEERAAREDGGRAQGTAVRGEIRVRTFGGFEVYVDGVPLTFKRAKSKELLAYLVDRRGSSVTLREAANILFEDGIYHAGRRSYMQTIYAELRSALAAVGAERMLRKQHNSYAVDPKAFDCDSYRYLNGDLMAINNYRNDYMICYSWSEYSMGAMEERRRGETYS
ncbi:MAG: response regulator [Eubacteriales bacterium]|nr:response regulator [Eubacteriales bacterium]